MPKNYNLYLKGYVGGWDFNADMVNYVLDKHKNEEVCVLIDSLGGNAATALSISSLFRIHGNVHCHYVGMNASAATIASMGAKRITIDANALFLVHKCLFSVFEWDYMNADDLAAHIAELDHLKNDAQTIDGCIAGMYAQRCKKSKDELLALMKEGAWLTAKQALEWGFVDEITNEAEDQKPELTDSMASDIVAAGMPMPPISVKKGSLLERIFQALGLGQSNSCCASGKPITKPAADPVEALADEAAQPTTTMSKVFTALAAALGAAVVLAEGTVTLTEAQADTLEKALGDSNATIADLNKNITDKDTENKQLKAAIAELEAKVADLSKEPAATTNELTPSAEDEIDMDKVADALINSIR